nr:protein COBRA-like [Ipomoea batatas]
MSVTWNVTCMYSQFLAQKTPTCCVSLSSFYNDTIVPCPTCTCGCQNNGTQRENCVEYVSLIFLFGFPKKLSFLNFHGAYLFDLSVFLWSCSPNSPHLASVVSDHGSANSKANLAPLVQCTNHMCPIRIHWHVKLNYKEYWRSELLFKKDLTSFTFEKGWAFPRRVYFNGDNCVMPPPDSYPYLPNTSSRHKTSLLSLVVALISSIAFFFV